MNKLKRFSIIIFFMSAVTNIIFYPFLPNKLIVQWGSSGHPNRYMAKPIGLIIMPLVILFINLFYKDRDDKTLQMVILCTILFIGNIVINIVNLLAA